MKLHLSVVLSFLLQSNIPIYRYTTICLSIHLCLDIQVPDHSYYEKKNYEHLDISLQMDVFFPLLHF
jgi:hypothetical protein